MHKVRHVAVLGLGNFGYYLGRELFSRGFEVIGIDIRKEVVQKVKNEVAQAVVADATDKDTLTALGLADVDLAVVTIGTNMLASILATFNLKEIGVRRVFAKALSAEHLRILKRVGADRVLFPEKDLALSLAQRIENPNMLEYLPTLENYSIYELPAPEQFHQQNLRDLNLINRYGIQVLAIRDKYDRKVTVTPKADFIVKPSHTLILLGPDESLKELSRVK
jgi:trk system potassium uptake protein TrkA